MTPFLVSGVNYSLQASQPVYNRQHVISIEQSFPRRALKVGLTAGANTAT